MSRRPSYASVAARAPLGAGLPSFPHSRTSSNDSTSTAGLTFEGESDARAVPITARSGNYSMASQPAHSGSQHDPPMSALEPNQLAEGWQNKLLRDSNMALYGRHTTMSGAGRGGQDRFIMPYYLGGTKYMERLVAKQNAKEAAARREAAESGAGPAAIGHSRNSSSVDLAVVNRLSTGSHRGLSYEVVEARPPENEASSEGSSSSSAADVAPLPGRWQQGEIEALGDGLALRWPSQRAGEVETVSCVMTDHPIPVATGLYYYELRVEHRPRNGHIALGIAHQKMSQSKLPGWEQRSWGWHSDDGKKYHGPHVTGNYSREWGKGDTVGCGIDFGERKIFFTRNGNRLDNAFTDIDRNDIVNVYPCIGMKAPGATVRINLGQEAFKYDIASEVSNIRSNVRAQYTGTKITRLTNGKKDEDLIKELVAQFLRHGGYVETARSFVSEVQAEQDALGTGWRISGNAAHEDIDAAQRQQIRGAILSGDVEKAMRCTADFYPQVLPDNPVIDFRLKCRRFLEMFKVRTGQLSSGPDDAPTSVSSSKKEKANATLPGASGAMDLDESPTSDGNDGKRGSYDSSALDLQMVIEEGSRLRLAYGDHPSREIRDTMRQMMAIWAYEDPTSSEEVGHLFRQAERVKMAEDLNSAILESMGKSSVAAVERMAQQTEVLLDEITGAGQPGAFVNLEMDVLR